MTDNLCMDHLEPSSKTAPPMSFGDVLTKVGALTGLVTAIAYFQGWVILREYYSELGASWYIPSITPTRIINEGATTLLAAGVCAFLAVQALVNGRPMKAVDRWCMVASVLALLIFGGGEVAAGFDVIGPAGSHLCASLTAGLLMAAVGGTAGQLVWSARSPTFQWKPHLGNLHWIYLIGFGVCPLLVGSTRAAAHLDPATSSLPVVTGQALLPTGVRLVEATGDVALVVRLADEARAAVFQVVKLDSGVEIAKPKRARASAAASSPRMEPTVAK